MSLKLLCSVVGAYDQVSDNTGPLVCVMGMTLCFCGLFVLEDDIVH